MLFRPSAPPESVSTTGAAADHNLTDIFYGFGADDVATQLSRADRLGSAEDQRTVPR